jgi:ferredoxin
VKAEVDQRKCRTAGACVKICPEVFRFQEGRKRAMVMVDEIPPDLEKKCLLAAQECPQNAVIIYRDT